MFSWTSPLSIVRSLLFGGHRRYPKLTSENRNISNGLNGDVSDRYLWVKEKQENALEYLNLSALFYSYCVLSIFGCFSAETVKIVKNSQNKDWTGKDVIMYMLLLILLCPKQWAQKFPYLVCESWRINVTEIVWLLQVRRRYFSGGEKRQPEIRMRLQVTPYKALYSNISVIQQRFLLVSLGCL